MRILLVLVLLVLLASSVTANCSFYQVNVQFAQCYWNSFTKWCYLKASYTNHNGGTVQFPEFMDWNDPKYGWTLNDAYGPWTDDPNSINVNSYINTGYASRPIDGENGALTVRFRYLCPLDGQWHDQYVSTPPGYTFNWCLSMGLCGTGL